MWLDLRSLWERTELAVTPGSVTIAGQSATPNLNLPLTAGSITIAGQAVTMQLGTVVALTAGSISIDGQSVSFALNVNPTLGTITVAGQSITPALGLAVTNGGIMLAGQSSTLSLGLALTQGTIDINGQSITLTLSGSLSLSIDSPGTITLTGHSITLDAPAQASGVTPAGRSGGKRRYYVEIDGQSFPVDSAQQARELLQRARAIAERQAEAKADKAVRVLRKREVVPEVVITAPAITVSPALAPDIAPLIEDIERLYKKAAEAAELRLLLAKQLADEEDDDDTVLLLI